MMTSPADPANDSSDWILRSNINIKERIVTIEYDPPIVAQHAAVIRFDTVELALEEVEVYGKLYAKYDYNKVTINCYAPKTLIKITLYKLFIELFQYIPVRQLVLVKQRKVYVLVFS